MKNLMFKNTEELQKQVNVGLTENYFLSSAKLLELAQKTFDKATEREIKDDDEQSYIFYMRSSFLYEKCRSAKDFNKIKDTSRFKQGCRNWITALEKADRLFDKLKSCYEATTATLQSELGDGGELQTFRFVPDDEATMQDVVKPGDSNPKKTSIQPYELYQDLQQNAQKILILDLRDQNAFRSCHIASTQCVNIPEAECCLTAANLERYLDITDRTLFRRRRQFEKIVLLDRSSADENAIMEAGKPLKLLRDAIFEYDNDPVKSPPLMLTGGFDAWLLRFPSLTTNPNYDNSSAGILEMSLADNEQMPTLSFVEMFKMLEEPAKAPAVAAQPAMPTIPDRKTKPLQKEEKSYYGDKNVLAFDDISQRIPTPENSVSSNGHVPPFEETQKLFDNTVSRHITMRDDLTSMGQKLRSLQAGGDDEDNSAPNISTNGDDAPAMLQLLEAKERELAKWQNLARLRQVKPTPVVQSNEAQDSARVVELENQVGSLRNKIEEMHRFLNIADKRRLDEVDRLRKLRLSKAISSSENKENEQIMDDESKYQLPQKKAELKSSSENLSVQSNQTLDPKPVAESESENVNLRIVCAQQNPVPDRSKKPNTTLDMQNPAQLELEYYTRHLNVLQGVSGQVPPGLTGLKNLGNTCYMNCTVQCLSNIAQLASYFKSGSYRSAINYHNPLGSKGEVARNFAVLVSGLWEGRFRYVIPNEFKQCINKVAPVFAGYDQQDAQEFLVFLLDGLHEDLNTVRERKPLPEQNNDGLGDKEAAELAWTNHLRINSSVVVSLFQGQYLSIVSCRSCQRPSRTFDVFMYLSLPIPSDRKCQLDDCLKKFLAPEDLCGDSRYYCTHCKQKRDVVKQIYVWKLPKILIIHLKRFSCIGLWGEKLKTHVDFPQTLDMSQYCQMPGSTYSLACVTNHYGNMEGGHYTAYCKNFDRRWYKYDDQDVDSISSASVKSPNAYILYYISDDAVGIRY